MVCPPRAPNGALMSVTPNLCCDETKNQGAYTRLTNPIQFIRFFLLEFMPFCVVKKSVPISKSLRFSPMFVPFLTLRLMILLQFVYICVCDFPWWLIW